MLTRCSTSAQDSKKPEPGIDRYALAAENVYMAGEKYLVLVGRGLVGRAVVAARFLSCDGVCDEIVREHDLKILPR